jgi:hypothetical protein
MMMMTMIMLNEELYFERIAVQLNPNCININQTVKRARNTEQKYVSVDVYLLGCKAA